MPLVVTGMAAARATLQAYVDAAKEHGSTKGYSVGSDLVYAAGIETGRRRSGRVARKAGGVFFMRNALEQVTHSGSVQGAIGDLPNNPDALRGIRQKLANAVAERARKILVPFNYSPSTRRHTGNLARSIRVTSGGGASVLTAPLIGAVARRPR